MKKLAVLSVCLGCVFAAASSGAIDLKQSKLTQVVNEVEIISAASQAQKAAAVNDIFAMPDILRTGPASRAELVAQDETVTRVGANTIFSFDPANRTIDLKQGSLLFHTPHGQGGGSIHTGSATASVLGTTVIVVTTPNGGFKVIALEGEVEVHFLNGLKQKLDPGQMTFVLPGANQLAPVIVFRLDELTQNSLLIQGFTQTLESLPLIENQIDKQLKLINSGRIIDTGLYAGDNATADQVEVLDLNTIQHGLNQAPQPQPQSTPPEPAPTPAPDLAAAETGDATLNTSSLTDPSVPTPPYHVYFSGFTLPDNAYFGSHEFSGFVAHNIYVNTADIIPVVRGAGAPDGVSGSLVNPLIIDLSPYADLATFDLVAVNDIAIEGSVAFAGLSDAASLELAAGNQFTIGSGIDLSADCRNFVISSAGSLLFDNDEVENGGLTRTVHNITLDSGGDITFQNNSEVNESGTLTLNAGGDIAVNSSLLVGAGALFSTVGGIVSMDNATLGFSDHVLVSAPGGITVDTTVINGNYITLNGNGPGTITLTDSILDGTSADVVNGLNNITIANSAQATGARPNAVTPGSALNVDPASGSVKITSTYGAISVTGTSISAHYLTLNSGDGILLDPHGLPLYATGSGATANLTTGGLATVNNADFSDYGTVNISANTIDLYNVHFTGVVNLESSLGYWFNGYMPGAVNDLGLVYYDDVLVTAPNYSTGQLTGTDINVGGLGATPAAVEKFSGPRRM